MILELDCGNSCIKWRLITLEGQAHPVKSTSSFAELLSALGELASSIQHCRISSVRSEDFNQELKQQVDYAFKITPDFASTSSFVAGVRNGYEVPGSLGVDRWLAAIAAYNIYQVDCLVIDCGTAITADFVDKQGLHHGGAIAPGLSLLHSSLCQVGSLPKVAGVTDTKIGQKTDAAIKSGIWSMYQGFVQQQIEYAKKIFSSDFALILTGGDAQFLRPEFKTAYYHSDLVFVGLGLACPLKE